MMTLGGGGAGGGEGGSMSPLTELSGDIAGKLNVLLTDSDDESELSSEGLVREEKVEEIMQELYREITSSSYNNNNNNSTTSFLTTATLTSPSSSSTSSSPFPFSSPPLFLAVNDVKSESCGASMSDSSSTVMAGIKFMGPAVNFDDGKTGFPATGNGSTGGELWVMGMGFEQVDHEKSHIHSSSNSKSNAVVVGGGGSVMDSLGLGLGLGSGVGKEEEKTEGPDEGEGEDQWLARVLGWGPLELEEWT